jgi:hypothetical protein
MEFSNPNKFLKMAPGAAPSLLFLDALPLFYGPDLFFKNTCFFSNHRLISPIFDAP